LLLASGIVALAGLLVIFPIVYLVYVGITAKLIGVVALLCVLTMGLVLPLCETLRRVGAHLPMLIPASTALVLSIVAFGSLGFDSERPQPNSIFFTQDSELKAAFWASSDKNVDSWTSAFLGETPKRRSMSDQFGAMDYPFLYAKAPFADQLPPPRIELTTEKLDDETRLIKVRISSVRNPEQVWINVVPSSGVESALLNDRPLRAGSAGRRPWTVRYVGFPKEGINLTLRLKGALGRIQVVDRTSGLPELPIVSTNPRPSGMIATPVFEEFQDATFVSASLAFDLIGDSQ
jgi:hypothetical protein